MKQHFARRSSARVEIGSSPSCFASLAAGCAYVGDVRPPLLEIPERVTDLRAAEYGDKIAVEFTLPPLTTEGEALKNVQRIELHVNDGEDHMIAIPARDSGAVAFDAPVAAFVGKQVMLAVLIDRIQRKIVGLRRTLWRLTSIRRWRRQRMWPRPTRRRAFYLTWTGSAPHYRIYRALGSGTPARLGESDTPTYEDATITLGTEYRYFVQALDGDQHQSEVSSAASFTPKDEFAPAVPEGLAGVPGVGAIELIWQRNTEEDFAGYNLYRAAAGGAFQKVAGPIDAPAYSDHDIEAGKELSLRGQRAGSHGERKRADDGDRSRRAVTGLKQFAVRARRTYAATSSLAAVLRQILRVSHANKISSRAPPPLPSESTPMRPFAPQCL